MNRLAGLEDVGAFIKISPTESGPDLITITPQAGILGPIAPRSYDSSDEGFSIPSVSTEQSQEGPMEYYVEDDESIFEEVLDTEAAGEERSEEPRPAADLVEQLNIGGAPHDQQWNVQRIAAWMDVVERHRRQLSEE